MFSRNGLSTKYHTFSKHIKSIKMNVTTKYFQDFNKVGDPTKVFRLTSMYNGLLHSARIKKGGVFNVNHICAPATAIYNKLFPERSSFIQDRTGSVRNASLFFGKKTSKYLLCSFASAGLVSKDSIPDLPEIPTPPVIEETLQQLNALGEPTFASLGLGGWSPIGIVQNVFEYFHVSLGIPWWAAIVMGTVIIRIMMFPLVIIAQQNAARMNNYLPQMQILQMKMSEARQMGNALESAMYSQELMLFMRDKRLNPLKNMLVPIAQMPIFISFFVGLRRMAITPVESLRDGGMFWFTDLTVPDQFYGLPIITSLTLWATIELGTDAAKLSSQNMQVMKYVLRAMPIVILPFIVNFPAAILCYWVSSNFISLTQVAFLRIPTVRDYFNIEAMIKHNPENMPIKSKGFVGGIKESWTNLKISKEMEDRNKFDEVQFRRAGHGPIVKTHKYDPTRQVTNNPSAISAKKR